MSSKARVPSAFALETHNYVTRGMKKNGALQREQITQGRTADQTYRRTERTCVSCEGPRTGSSPICGRCNGGRGL